MNQFQEESPKAEILEAALQEFSLHGKQGARMQTIADVAGVNKALLHYYFTSKENLYHEVLQRILTLGLFNVGDSFDDSFPPKQQIENLISNYFQFFCDHPEMPRLMMWEVTTNPEIMTQMFSTVIEQTNAPLPKMLDHVISQGVEDGSFCPVDSDQFIVTLLGSIAFYFIGKPVINQVLSIKNEKRFLEFRENHLKKILLAGLERSA